MLTEENLADWLTVGSFGYQWCDVSQDIRRCRPGSELDQEGN